MNSTADTIYIYKDGPDFPDPELTGEQQLAEQRAYVESFAKFTDDETVARKGEDGDENGSDSGTEDFVPSDDEGEELPPEPLPEYKEPEPIEPSPFLQAIVMEERRLHGWLSLSKEIAAFMKGLAPGDINLAYSFDKTSGGTGQGFVYRMSSAWPKLIDVFALPPKWNEAIQNIEQHDTQDVINDLKQKLLNSAFRKHRADIQLLVRDDAVSNNRTSTTTPNEEETPTSEDEENFMNWLERYGRIRSWIVSSELITGICNQLATYGPPPPEDDIASDGEGPAHRRVDQPRLTERTLGELVLFYRYYQHRGQALLARLSETMFDPEDPDGLQLRLAVEIAQNRKQVKQMRQRAKASKSSRAEKRKTTVMGVPVSLPPPEKLDPTPHPDDTPEQRLARKRELLKLTEATLNNRNRKDTFDQWLEG